MDRVKSEKIQELSEKLNLARVEPVSLEMTYGEMFSVLADMVFRAVLPAQWVSPPTLTMIQSMFEKLIERFGREAFPPEFLEAWEYFQRFDTGEGEMKQRGD